ncbi:MAG: SIR2 family protein [Bacteroidetes bacterium]|nr:SIR2 family protein [Bacteroidota bacterium]
MSLEELFKHTVFLIGAGASKDAGCLISNDMLNRLYKEIIDISPDDAVYGNYKEGFKALYEVIKPALEYQSELRNIRSNQHKFYTPNIEDFILILRKIINKDLLIPEPLVGSWSEKLMMLEIKHPNVVNHYLNFLYHNVISWITPNDNFEKAKNTLEPLKKLLEQTNEQEYFIDVFSLNYDLTFEKVFNTEISRPLNNGFDNDKWNNSFSIPETKINLYKFHGSLDWYKKDDETLALNDYEVAFNKLDPDERKPHIILGYEYKLFSVDPFFSLIQSFIRKLDRANLVIVIGYSFFDAYLNNILIQFLNAKPDRKLFIVDPKFASENPADEKFTEYLKLIQSDTSSLNIDNYSMLPTSKVSFFMSEENAVIPGAAQFYKEYFADNCEKLKILYNRGLETEANPF